jgi:hypothetical protein
MITAVILLHLRLFPTTDDVGWMTRSTYKSGRKVYESYIQTLVYVQMLCLSVMTERISFTSLQNARKKKTQGNSMNNLKFSKCEMT